MSEPGRRRDGRFAPGASGNPGGRPRGFGELIREETRDGAELVMFVIGVLRDPKAKTADRMDAATWLSDRGYGRPMTTSDVRVSAPTAIRLFGFGARPDPSDPTGERVIDRDGRVIPALPVPGDDEQPLPRSLLRSRVLGIPRDVD